MSIADAMFVDDLEVKAAVVPARPGPVEDGRRQVERKAVGSQPGTAVSDAAAGTVRPVPARCRLPS
jgi:hypothetical protein